MGIETANQSRVNSPAGQWEPGGKDAIPILTPLPPIESCLEGQGGGVAERGAGRGRRGQVELAQERAVQRKTFKAAEGNIPAEPASTEP